MVQININQYLIKGGKDFNSTPQVIGEMPKELKEEACRALQDAFDQLRKFKPRVFISQEELNTTKRYEKENINFGSRCGYDNGDERDGICGRMGAGFHRLVVG